MPDPTYGAWDELDLARAERGTSGLSEQRLREVELAARSRRRVEAFEKLYVQVIVDQRSDPIIDAMLIELGKDFIARHRRWVEQAPKGLISRIFRKSMSSGEVRAICRKCDADLSAVAPVFPVDRTGGVNVGPRRCPECNDPWPRVPPRIPL